MDECIFLSKEPVSVDAYKAKQIRYICRNINRLQGDRRFSDRLVGEDTCKDCPYKFTQEQADNL